MLRLVPLFAAAAWLAACAPASTVAPSDTKTSSVIEIDDAYLVRPAAGNAIAGAGFTATVSGPDVTLSAASSPIADKVEFHTMSMDGDRMQMRQVEDFKVSENAPLKLERGGDHLMLFGVKDGLVEGETADIILTFTLADGTTQDIVAEATIVPPGG